MYSSRHYLSIDSEKSLPRPFKRPQTAKTCDAHNLHDWNVLFSTIPIDWPKKKIATPTLTPTNRENLWRPKLRPLKRPQTAKPVTPTIWMLDKKF